MLRTIDQLFRGKPFHMVGDGFRVSNYFPQASDRQKRLSPFFLLDYHPPYVYSPTPQRRGVGSHPHRGFETVTLAYQGAVAHHDSRGNGGIIYPGDVQWMTAGAGILHNEYHEKAFGLTGGVMQMMQIWVNLPKRFKATDPKYQGITTREIPRVSIADGRGSVRVISGAYQNAKGPASTFTPVNIWDVQLAAGAAVTLPIPRHFNGGLIVLQGDVVINGESKAGEKDFALFKNDGDEVCIQANADASLLFLNGEPIDEPLVHYGPFVMNSIDEINDAITDFNDGKFGHLDN